MKMTLRLLLMLWLSLPPALVFAQFSGGIIAGMNLSKLIGPSEVDASGDELEDYSFKTGFHLGGRFNYRFTDAFGLRGELLYSQKGATYSYDGTSYWVFQDEAGQLLYSTGNRNTDLKIVNNYLEVPIMAFYQLGPVEFSGGAYFSWLFRSTGSGELRYSGVSENGNPIDEFTISLLFNYYSDNFQPINAEDTQPVEVDGDIIQVPEVIGAQYDLITEPEDRLFKRFDYGLIANVAVYLNEGLFIGGRLNYGLADITRTERDVSRYQLDENKQAIFRDDADRNLTLQISLGFSFR